MKSASKRGVSVATRPHFVLRWTRNIFLIVGVLILSYCAVVLLDSKLYQADETRRFQQQLNEPRPTDAGAGRVRQVSLHPAAGGVLGQIEMTRLGVTAMILEGTEDRTLRRAVGHIAGTASPGQPGNIGIAGHRDTFFRDLREFREGDEITLTTLEGSYSYRVESISVVGPEDTHVLDRTDDDVLTLVTCYPFYFVGPAPRRFIVRAQRIRQ